MPPSTCSTYDEQGRATFLVTADFCRHSTVNVRILSREIWTDGQLCASTCYTIAAKAHKSTQNNRFARLLPLQEWCWLLLARSKRSSTRVSPLIGWANFRRNFEQLQHRCYSRFFTRDFGTPGILESIECSRLSITPPLRDPNSFSQEGLQLMVGNVRVQARHRRHKPGPKPAASRQPFRVQFHPSLQEGNHVRKNLPVCT